MSNFIEKTKKIFGSLTHKQDVDESKVSLNTAFAWRISRIFFVCTLLVFIGFGVWLFLSLYKDPELSPNNDVKKTTFNQRQYQDVVDYVKNRATKFTNLQTPPSVLDPSL